MAKRILIADDEPAVRTLLELMLKQHKYDVISVHNGDQLVRMAQELVPDLIMVDLMMPQMDGYEAIRQLRNDTRTAHLPMIILTAKMTAEDVVSGFETGADDYITKPFNIPELMARIKSHLARASRRPVQNPLTGLPGNILLTEEIKYRIKNGAPFALLYVDIDNFKAFNDTYGPARGDRVIRALAEILTEKVRIHGATGDFIGHIGGDDFAVITTTDRYTELCQIFMHTFDDRVRNLYDPDDLERGYLQGADRQGVIRRFPITSLSIGVVTNRQRLFGDYEIMTRVAAEMKQYAKQQPGSSYAVDGRADDAPLGDIPERRGSPPPAVLMISPEDELRHSASQMLKRAGYRTLEAPSLLDAEVLLAYELDLALIILDDALGHGVWEMLQSIRDERPELPLLLVTSDPNQSVPSRVSGINLIARVHLQRLAEWVARAIQHDSSL